MMRKRIILSLTTIALLLCSNVSFSQTPNGTLNLGILESFEAYTGAGGVTNSGGTVTGDVGTNLGIISGFTAPDYPGTYTGNIYKEDTITDQARYDLLRLYINLNALFVNFPNALDPATFPAHAAAFGGGETLVPGVYSIGSAGSLTAGLTLDGGGDPNAVFVIKMNGAFTVAAGATVSLTNGAKSSNVFWLISGAISVAADAEVKGTLFSKAGAVGLGARVILEGRMLSMAGAITMGINSSATPPPLPSTIPIFCESVCAPTAAVDILGVLSNFTLFSKSGSVGNTGISGINGTIGTNAGAITGYSTGGIHIGTEEIANALTIQAAVDLDTAYNRLMAMTPTVTHVADFLNETLAPGVYHIPTAGSLNGVVILDAANDPDAIFVFRFAGAFNIAAASKIILINGARRCNIFWLAGAGVATGALNIGASCEIQGTFIAHEGACNSGGGVFMAGRQLSTFGAVNTDNAVIYTNPECVTSTSLKTISAVTDSLSASAGQNTSSVINNDILDKLPAVIGTAPGEVTLSFTPTAYLVMDSTGVITVAPNTPDGDYPITYKICEVSDTTNCSSITSIVTVNAQGVLVIVAVADTLSALAGQTTTPSVIENDTLNGALAVIGTASGDVILTGITVPAGLTLNTDGTVTVAANTPAGNYSLMYKICEFSDPTNCDSVSSIIVVSATSFALVKSGVISGTGTGLLGEVITYTFAVTNTGSTTLTNVVVTDTMVGLTIAGSPIVSLAGGDSSSAITGTYTITEADIEAGGVTNSALATATDPNNIDITDISGTAKDNDLSTVTTVTRSASVALVKTESVNGTGALGDVITYTFKVINTGNDSLTNVVVTDTMVGLTITGSPITSLAAGDSSSAITGTYTITQANIDAGGVTNSALVTAKDPNNIDVTDISGTTIDNDISTVTTISPVSAIALVKTARVSGAGALGDVITYIFTVTNTGNATLTNVVVTDSMVAITGSPISSLAPGTIAIAMATYTITQTDIDSGSVTNSALVTAKDPEGVDVSDVSGTANDNDTPTVTVTPTLNATVPDLSPTIDIDGYGFLSAGSTKDFVVNISEIGGGAPSNGQVVFKISKGSAFLITYDANMSTSNFNGGVPVNNVNWVMDDTGNFITMTLKPNVIIEPNTSSAIGFTIERNSDVGSQSSQPITVTIVNGSGLDSQNYNNGYNIVVTAQ
jgi:hypothetical protein